MDAYLAAFALTGGFELVTTDTNFMQYRGIDLRLLTARREREARRKAELMPKTLARGRYGTFSSAHPGDRRN